MVGLSADSRPALRSWSGSMGGIAYPLLSDFWPHGQTLEAYGVFNADSGMARRALFIIDPDGVTRHFELHQGTLPDPTAVLAELDKFRA